MHLRDIDIFKQMPLQEDGTATVTNRSTSTLRCGMETGFGESTFIQRPFAIWGSE